MSTKTAKPKTKASKGTVTAKNSNGRLQLVFRHPVTHKQRFVSTGLTYSERNKRASLATTGAEIEKALAWGNIDEWLEDFQTQKKPQATTEAVTLKLSLSELWERYTAHRVEVGAKGKPIAPSTIERDYRRVQKRIETLPSKLDDPSKAEEIKAHWKTKFTSDETVRRTLMQVNACCAWAVEAGLLKANSFEDLPRPAQKRNGDSTSYRAFDANERTAIIESFEKDTYSPKYASVTHSFYTGYVKLMFMFGCRPEELVALTWGDVSEDFKAIRIDKARPCDTKIQGNTKTNKARTINCNAQQEQFLRELKPEAASKSDLIVSGVKGGFLDYHNFATRVWKQVLNSLVAAGKVDKYLSPYHMRHTAITEALKTGVNVTDIAYMVGNSPKTIFEHYASVQKTATMPEI